jgi:plastocyanin
MPMDQRPLCAPRRETGGAIDRRQVMRGMTGLGLAATGAVGWFALRGANAAETYPGTPGASPVASPIASPIASPTAGVQVAIDNFSFNPPTLTVAVGTEVTWVNHDDIPHTVTSNDTTTFASDLLDTDDTFTYRFEAPGTFPYFCSLHPFMTANVVVQ